jgi:membrane protein implicated in regulation of membrane protease activity
MEPMFFFYLTLGAMLFLIISLLLGTGDDIGHGDAGSHGHAGDGGHGHGHAGDGGHGHGHNADSDNMSIWSFQMLFLFTAGFGAGGYFASLYRLSAPITILCGVLGGAVLASIGYFIINIFYRRQGNSNVYSEEYIGLTGIVVTSISGDSVGQVRCAVGAQRETFLAKSVDGNTIPINSLVRITDIVGSTAIVEITDADQQTSMPWRRELS